MGRLHNLIAVAACASLAGAYRCPAADSVGGSLALTSDYFVRGITRSDDQAALQLDLHYVESSGLMAGVFVSNTQIDPGRSRDAELNGYVGFAWRGNGDWHGRVLGGYYAYPWNAYGSVYNYAEFDLDVGYRDWLDLAASYSPDTPRYVAGRGLKGVAAESLELNLQHALVGRLSATGGIGYNDLGGAGGTGYVYWSVGAACDLAPVLLTVSYVDTSAAAKSLFYDTAATGRFTGTVIWRF